MCGTLDAEESGGVGGVVERERLRGVAEGVGGEEVSSGGSQLVLSYGRFG